MFGNINNLPLQGMVLESYQEIPRIWTAIAEWASCLVYILLLRPKGNVKKLIVTAAGMLALQCLYMMLTDNVGLVFWIPAMVGALALMFLFIDLELSYNTVTDLYYTMGAFIMSEFAASLGWQIAYFIATDMSAKKIIVNVVMLLMYMVIFCTVFVLFRSQLKTDFHLEIQKKDLVTVIIMGIITFALSNISFISLNTPFSGQQFMDTFNIRTFVDLGGLAIIYAYHSRISELQASKEVMQINSMLKAQYDSYRNYQENIDLINVKYHDLKHQIIGLRAETDAEKRNEWLDQLEAELSQYQPARQTGNHVLDAVLDAKMIRCRNSKINFTCVADGSLLSFIHVTDICTIFGNALDNAIENVALVNDPQKRTIHMTLAARKNFVYIEFRNYCEEELVIQKGFPVTSKRDKANHGFGVRSIAMAVKKYDGTISFKVENNTFILTALIPIPDTAR